MYSHLANFLKESIVLHFSQTSVVAYIYRASRVSAGSFPVCRQTLYSRETKMRWWRGLLHRRGRERLSATKMPWYKHNSKFYLFSSCFSRCLELSFNISHGIFYKQHCLGVNYILSQPCLSHPLCLLML